MRQREKNRNQRSKMTEREYAPRKNEKKKMVVETIGKKVSDPQVKKEEVGTSKEEKMEKNEKQNQGDEKTSDAGKTEDKKSVQSAKPKVREKTFAITNARSVPVSTKYSMAICRFIKGKKIDDAINDLEKVIRKKIPVKMKGEIPHRKGKMMSGRFPIAASKHFIKILKGLKGNSAVNKIENAVVSEAVANKAQTPLGRFGSVQRKRTHIKIVAREKPMEVKK